MTTNNTGSSQKIKRKKVLKKNKMGTKDSREPVEKIKKLHSEIMNTTFTALEKGVRVGELLIVQKEQVGHGNWKKWFEDNDFEFSSRTASRYIKLAQNQDIVKSEKSLRKALELLKDESANGRSSEKKSEATKTDTRGCFKVTVNKDKPDELVKELKEKFGEDFLSELIEHIQRINKESEKRD